MGVIKYKDPDSGDIKTVGLPNVDNYNKNEIDVKIMGLTEQLDNKATLDESGKVSIEPLPDISTVKVYTATIGTTWTEDGNTGVKTQTVSIDGVTAEHTANVDHYHNGDGTSDGYAAFVEEENQYLTCITNGFAETVDGGIKFTIFGDTNTVTIPIIVEVV